MRSNFLYLALACLLGFSTEVFAQDLGKAAQIYKRQCGRCHGIKGGGGTGPSLLRPFLPRAPDDQALFSLIRSGIPGSGMPPNYFLEVHEVNAIVTYVRYLGASQQSEILGDPVAGKTLFMKGDCATCHIISGAGGSLGPELTLVGQRRGPNYLQNAIQHPGMEKPLDREGFMQYLVVSAETNDGKTISGVRINEDSFTIQIKDATNRIHSLKKADIKSLASHKEKSLMPGYEDIFDETEVQDIIAYLATLK